MENSIDDFVVYYMLIVFGALIASVFILMFMAFVKMMWDIITDKW